MLASMVWGVAGAAWTRLHLQGPPNEPKGNAGCVQALGRPKSTTLSLRKNSRHLLMIRFALGCKLTELPSPCVLLSTLGGYYGHSPGEETEAYKGCLSRVTRQVGGRAGIGIEV